eukprot:GEMP01069871.1.p1 GENE.GEMP01069871.1~~GEMP01069871.1.p1  ORF type:complete len:132 (+),score=42.57 GEMP01069871.1:144-539(+)
MDAAEEAQAKQVAANQAMNEGAVMQQMEQQKKAQETEAMEEEKRKGIMRQILDTGAQERLARIGLVKPDKKRGVEQILISMVQQGQLKSKLNESQLIELLEKLEGEKASTVKIHRKRVGDESDDDINLDDC